jgi:hypothetical protein
VCEGSANVSEVIGGLTGISREHTIHAVFVDSVVCSKSCDWSCNDIAPDKEVIESDACPVAAARIGVGVRLGPAPALVTSRRTGSA